MSNLTINAPHDPKERPIFLDDLLDRWNVERVMTNHPKLTTHGFGFGGLVSPTDYNRRQLESRIDMFSLNAMAQFARAVTWLKPFPRTNSLNKRQTSYGLKHEAEKWVRANYSGDGYVGNGMFIVAAIHLGFRFLIASRTTDEPNVYINISSRPRPRNGVRVYSIAVTSCRGF